MKRAFIFLFLLYGTGSYGAGFLQAQKFPTVFSDLPFTERIKIKQDGYDDWASEYDSNGVCISHCTYYGITIKEEMEIMHQATEQAVQALQDTLVQSQQQNDNSDGVLGSVATSLLSKRCQPNNPNSKEGKIKPYGYPLAGNPIITSPFCERILNGQREPHKGIDFSAPVGTNVFATADGRVARVWTDKRCGNGLVIEHSDGFETLFCHLSQVLVKQGETVKSGCLVAKTGNTGRSTGPHLHYAVKYNGIHIDPAKTF